MPFTLYHIDPRYGVEEETGLLVSYFDLQVRLRLIESTEIGLGFNVAKWKIIDGTTTLYEDVVYDQWDEFASHADGIQAMNLQNIAYPMLENKYL